MSLRLGINLLWLVPGVVGGTEEAAVGFLRELLDETTPGLEVTLFALEAFEEAHPDLCALADVDLLKLDGRSRAARVAAESTWLAKAARAKRIDLMHNYGVRPRWCRWRLRCSPCTTSRCSTTPRTSRLSSVVGFARCCRAR